MPPPPAANASTNGRVMFGIYYLNPMVAVWVVLTIAGGWWCKEILERLGDDRERVRSSDDRTLRGVIVFFWVLTIPVALLTGWSVFCLIARTVGGIMSLF